MGIQSLVVRDEANTIIVYKLYHRTRRHDPGNECSPATGISRIICIHIISRARAIYLKGVDEGRTQHAMVYIARVIPASTNNCNDFHRTDVDPVSHSIELAYSPFTNRYAARVSSASGRHTKRDSISVTSSTSLYFSVSRIRVVVLSCV